MRQIFLLASILLLFSCNKENADLVTHELGEVMPLRFKECVNVESGSSSFKVCFDRVMNEGRCLWSDCQSCFGSLAEIEMTMLSHTSDTAVVGLSVVGCVDGISESSCSWQGKDTLGYRFCLLSLDPYPDHGNVPIPHSVYTAQLVISAL